MKKSKTVKADFRKVSIGSEVASIGIHIKREELALTDADELLTNAQLDAVLLIDIGGARAAGQPQLAGGLAELTLDAVVTSKGLSVKKADLSATLSMPVDDTDLGLLARFANRSGTVKLQRTGDAPEAKRGRPAASEEHE